VSDIVPMSYAVDGLSRVATTSGIDGTLLVDLAVVAGCTALALLLAAATLRRRTA
jgi:ABC-2 type transport system permease protein